MARIQWESSVDTVHVKWNIIPIGKVKLFHALQKYYICPFPCESQLNTTVFWMALSTSLPVEPSLRNVPWWLSALWLSDNQLSCWNVSARADRLFALLLLPTYWALELVAIDGAKNWLDRKRGRHAGSEITTRPMPSSTTDQIATSVLAPKVRY
jgi:hypothetical protein